jgi:hypothetical protein
MELFGVSIWDVMSYAQEAVGPCRLQFFPADPLTMYVRKNLDKAFTV